MTGVEPAGARHSARHRDPYGDGEPLVTDGPFAETKEQLAGFWMIEVENLDEALAWAKKIPLQSGHVEIRPMVTGGEELLEKAERS